MPSFFHHKLDTTSIKPSRMAGQRQPCRDTLAPWSSSFIFVTQKASQKTSVFQPTSLSCVPSQHPVLVSTPGVRQVATCLPSRRGTLHITLSGKVAHVCGTSLTASGTWHLGIRGVLLVPQLTPRCLLNSLRTSTSHLILTSRWLRVRPLLSGDNAA